MHSAGHLTWTHPDYEDPEEPESYDYEHGGFGECFIYDRIVVKKSLNKLCEEISHPSYLALMDTALTKEALIMRYLNKKDTQNRYVPVILSMKTDAYQWEHYNHPFNLVQEIQMTKVGSKNCHHISKQAFQLKPFLEQMLDALCFLHTHGILHCDITASNIMYNGISGNYTLIDFGSSQFIMDNVLDEMKLSLVAPVSNMYLVKTDEEELLYANSGMYLADIDPRMMSVLYKRQTTIIPYMDIGIVMSVNQQLERYTEKSDCYALAQCAVTLAGLPNYNVQENHPSHRVQEMCVASFKDIRENPDHAEVIWDSHLLKLCESNVRLRGCLTLEELAIWLNFINNVSEVTGVMMQHESTPLLDKLDGVFEPGVADVLKNMLHPVRDYRFNADQSKKHLNNWVLPSPDLRINPEYGRQLMPHRQIKYTLYHKLTTEDSVPLACIIVKKRSAKRVRIGHFSVQPIMQRQPIHLLNWMYRAVLSVTPYEYGLCFDLQRPQRKMLMTCLRAMLTENGYAVKYKCDKQVLVDIRHTEDATE